MRNLRRLMKYTTHLPPPELSGYVRFFWTLEHELLPGESYVHRTMPDGCCELYFHYQGVFEELMGTGSQTSDVSGITGPSGNFNRFRVRESFGMVGAYVYPFAIPRLFGIPVSLLSNHSPCFKTVLGAEGKELENRIMEAADNRERISLLSAFLQRGAARYKETDLSMRHVISRLIHSRGNGKVEKLAAESFLSVRQFERKFRDNAGFSPKLFSRIIRFQSALAAYGKKNGSLTSLALDCGYYDQSHFIHEFRSFSGLHPSDYFSGKTEATEWKTI
jgi:AraC-like DNA-binding protein